MSSSKFEVGFKLIDYVKPTAPVLEKRDYEEENDEDYERAFCDDDAAIPYWNYFVKPEKANKQVLENISFRIMLNNVEIAKRTIEDLQVRIKTKKATKNTTNNYIRHHYNFLQTLVQKFAFFQFNLKTLQRVSNLDIQQVLI